MPSQSGQGSRSCPTWVHHPNTLAGVFTPHAMKTIESISSSKVLLDPWFSGHMTSDDRVKLILNALPAKPWFARNYEQFLENLKVYLQPQTIQVNEPRVRSQLQDSPPPRYEDTTILPDHMRYYREVTRKLMVKILDQEAQRARSQPNPENWGSLIAPTSRIEQAALVEFRHRSGGYISDRSNVVSRHRANTRQGNTKAKGTKTNKIKTAFKRFWNKLERSAMAEFKHASGGSLA